MLGTRRPGMLGERLQDAYGQRYMAKMDEREAKALRLELGRHITRFHTGQIDPAHTVDLYIGNGWSLVIAWNDCPRMTEWTPDELKAKFEDRPGLRIRDLAARLSCTGEGGCGSKDVAVFPLPADRPRPAPRPEEGPESGDLFDS